ncbi:hypothetical protein A2617_02970 [Candidatus Daviesbacteria bacterium RIFOXYD1_FULL_41_10]|uniref:Mannosyl-glycoprotein endo-beta-N-acetylglucosamidase-like domain-containing protein n=1 Tax=Candidatus Daviesbacteria bacterium RIFOXYD1_FULL_41_10 TaxID=1797801 RepID=A0A1F5N3T9_9BACT|nr:MAG: hypothetical protein A2617_02970 [Candidatus Daviesbacteria bacterium RIFOXYD1_FULL_41_10]
MRSLNFAFAYFAAGICTFFFAIIFLVYLSLPREINNIKPRYQMYKALPKNLTAQTNQKIDIKKNDGRPQIVKEFFGNRRSPLAEFAPDFVNTADRYGLDFRLLPAIAMQESGGGKIFPKGSFNPFGYGIYGGKVLRFTSFKEAIDKVGEGLKQDYIDKGLKTPEEIMAKYTPPSLKKGGAWAMGVSAFMQSLN